MERNFQTQSRNLVGRRKITLNVSGQRFTIWEQTLNVFPNTLLGSAARWKFYDKEKKEFFFDRDPFIFRYILNYYRSQNLHTSPQDCPQAFKEELDFFGIPAFNDIDLCCANFDRCAKTRNNSTISASRRASKSSILHLASHKENQFRFESSCNVLSNSQLISTACANGDVADVANKRFETKLSQTACANDEIRVKEQDAPEKKVLLVQYDNAKTDVTCCKEKDKSTSAFRKIHFFFRYCYSLLVIASVASTTAETMDCADKTKCEKMYPTLFFTLDTIFVAVFSLELVARFVTSRNKIAFAGNIFNIVDFLSILPYYIDLAVSLFVGTTEILITLRVLRVCRILKLTRNSLRLQSFIATIRKCFSDLVFLYFTLTLAIALFASCFYYIERDENPKGFESIPQSFWYTYVTMTTTGYGDVVPVSILGKVVGGICAFCGVLIMSLPIPIIQENKVEETEVDIQRQ